MRDRDIAKGERAREHAIEVIDAMLASSQQDRNLDHAQMDAALHAVHVDPANVLRMLATMAMDRRQYVVTVLEQTRPDVAVPSWAGLRRDACA